MKWLRRGGPFDGVAMGDQHGNIFRIYQPRWFELDRWTRWYWWRLTESVYYRWPRWFIGSEVWPPRTRRELAIVRVASLQWDRWEERPMRALRDPDLRLQGVPGPDAIHRIQ